MEDERQSARYFLRDYLRRFSPAVNPSTFGRAPTRDISAGIASAAVVVPLALGLGYIVGEPLSLWSALVCFVTIGLVYPFFGSVSVQAGGATVVMAVVAASVAHGEAKASYVAAIFLLAGLFQVVLAMGGVGKFLRYVSPLALDALKTGAAAALILWSLQVMWGSDPTWPVAPALGHTRALASVPQWQELLVGGAACATVMVLALFKRRSLSLLTLLGGVAVGTGVAYLPWLDVTRLADVNRHFAAVAPSAQNATSLSLLLPALLLALVSSAEALRKSEIAENLPGGNRDSGRELCALGLGNMLSALFGGIPGTHSTRRTVQNAALGARSPLAGLVTAIIVIPVAVFAGPYVILLPRAALAGMLMGVGLMALSLRPFMRVRAAPVIDTVCFFVVFASTLMLDLTFALIICFLTGALLFIVRLGEATGGEVVSIHDSPVPRGGEEKLPASMAPFTAIFRPEGPFQLDAVMAFASQALRRTRLKVLVLRLNKVTLIEPRIVADLRDAVTRVRNKGVHVLVVGAPGRVLRAMENAGILYRIGRENAVAQFGDALERMRELLAHDPDVELLETIRQDIVSVGAPHVARALRGLVRRHVLSQTAVLLGILLFVGAGFFLLHMGFHVGVAALANIEGYRGQASLFGWVTDHSWLVFSILFGLALALSTVASLRRKVPVAMSPWVSVDALGVDLALKSAGGCLMLAPNLLAETLIEVTGVFTKRYHEQTVNTAAMIMSKMTERTTWRMLKGSLREHLDYDLMMALTMLRQFELLDWAHSRDDFDISITEQGKEFIEGTIQRQLRRAGLTRDGQEKPLTF